MNEKMQNLAIVTGGAKGIGSAIVRHLIDDGFYVVVADIEEVNGNDSLQSIRCNIADEQDVQSLFNQLPAIPRVLVNNAGIIRDKMIWKMSADEFDEVIRVNLRGAWLMCREAAMRMREAKYGRIINITSRAWLGNPGQTNYSASKAGMIGLTRALALEMGPSNVTVNAVAPGLTDTPLTQNLPDQVREKLISLQPTKCMGSMDDIAQMVAFLAKPENKFITGQVFHVDGGRNIGTTVF